MAQPNGATPAAEAAFDSIPDAVEAFARGDFVIVLDSPARENEGDLIIAASALTPAKTAFLVRHSLGYLCAPLLPARAKELDLPQMVESNEDPNRTAYTITVDANLPSITTGISAQDRATTCNLLASPDAKRGDFRRPGHVVPLRAREGGVRERAGHTEAAVDLCRLAGLEAVGVIAELVEGGETVEGKGELGGEVGMMRRDACLAFGKRFGIRCVNIEGLVGYLEKGEKGLAPR